MKSRAWLEWLAAAVPLWAFFLIHTFHIIGFPIPSAWLGEKGDDAVIIAVSVLGIYLLHRDLGSRDARDKQHLLLQNIDLATSRIERRAVTIEVGDHEAFLKYAIGKINGATKSVKDLSWAHDGHTEILTETRKRLEADYNAAVSRAAKKISYQEVFIFSRPGRRRRAAHRLEQQLEFYGCSYFDESPLPRIQFMIIDDSHLIFMRLGASNATASSDPYLVRYFSSYYDNVWERSIKIKTPGDLFRHAALPDALPKGC